MKGFNVKKNAPKNIAKSSIFKKYKRKRRKEKFFRFITLPTFLWTMAFLLMSLLILLGSYFINEANPWVSGVLVSISCGIITGVILYFLSNLRNNKLYILQTEHDEIYNIYRLICSLFFAKTTIDNSRVLGTYDVTIQEECEDIMEKLDQLECELNSETIT